ncbi:MAG: RluA family pseudouridine synthase [Oscillospiraceae bacterium]|nr:RluA family pseudouridine synthase [Oscillospiraceae bacterium]
MRVFECRADRKMSVRQLIRERYDMSSNLVTQLKNTGGIKVNGEARMANYMMNEGDLLSLEMIDKPSDIECVNIPIDIVYEDEDIAVINKPPYLPTHISPGHRNDTLSNALMYHFRENNEEHTFRAVNRLDNDTSGLMIAAKNTYSHHKLSVQTSNKILKRKYIAVVCGKTPDSGVIRLPIGRESGSVIKRQVCSWGKTPSRIIKP